MSDQNERISHTTLSDFLLHNQMTCYLVTMLRSKGYSDAQVGEFFGNDQADLVNAFVYITEVQLMELLRERMDDAQPEEDAVISLLAGLTVKEMSEEGSLQEEDFEKAYAAATKTLKLALTNTGKTIRDKLVNLANDIQSQEPIPEENVSQPSSGNPKPAPRSVLTSEQLYNHAKDLFCAVNLKYGEEEAASQTAEWIAEQYGILDIEDHAKDHAAIAAILNLIKIEFGQVSREDSHD